ncbi:MAG: 4Fe-4S dicluster domain-containing protein [Phycisphaerae bacterium]|jgi:heterodisulfide reductase subunit C|nr:4Fe-4S dicluster domain-containing protein [Phycisphaerae bacterium]
MSDNPEIKIDEETCYAQCFSCAKCTSGCPVADEMDIKPHQAMRLLQLGEVDQLVVAASPWICVGCQTCLGRCPNNVDIPSAFSRIRQEAIERGQLDNAGNVPLFDDIMLGMIKRKGRVNDGLMAAKFKFKAGGLFKDWRMGLKMLKAGKMKLFMKGVNDRAGVAGLFDKRPRDAEDK